MNKSVFLIAEAIAGFLVVLALYGLWSGIAGSYVTISESTGMYLSIFLCLLVIIDVYLIVQTLTAAERD